MKRGILLFAFLLLILGFVGCENSDEFRPNRVEIANLEKVDWNATVENFTKDISDKNYETESTKIVVNPEELENLQWKDGIAIRFKDASFESQKCSAKYNFDETLNGINYYFTGTSEKVTPIYIFFKEKFEATCGEPSIEQEKENTIISAWNYNGIQITLQFIKDTSNLNFDTTVPLMIQINQISL